MWLTVPGYRGIQDPRISCRLRPRILPAESRERLDHNQGLAEDKNLSDFKRRERKNVNHKMTEYEDYGQLFPPTPSPKVT